MKGNGKRETPRPGANPRAAFPSPNSPARTPATRRWTREELHACRSQPLEPVAKRLGYRQHPADRAKWRRPGSILSINGSRFFDHHQGTGGAGAFDLVIHARNCSFAEAAAALIPALPDPSLRIPNPCKRQWPAVRQRLHQLRAIPNPVLNACRQHGILHADRRQNAVFLCTDTRRQTTGAEILATQPETNGTTRKSMARGSRKANGGFWIPADQYPVKTVILVESALDVLAAWILIRTQHPASAFVSTAGTTNQCPKWIEAWNPRSILCAFDADHPGDQAAKRLQQNSQPRTRRLKPQGARDWCEILKARSDRNSQPPHDRSPRGQQ